MGMGNQICTDCHPGSYSARDAAMILSDDGPAMCTACAAGTYAPSAGRQACTPCDLGRYVNTTNNTDCVDCEPGYFSDVKNETDGPTSCMACIEGRYSPGRVQSCINCPNGKFVNDTGRAVCSPCPVGAVSLSNPDLPAGPAACTPCGIGEGPDTLNATCIGCSVGTYSVSGACLLCPVGKYQNNTRSANCFNCSMGQYASGLGSVFCTDCPVGSYSVNGPCQSCAVGTYQNATRASACLNCTAGLYASGDGSVFCSDCPTGTYAPTYALTSCLRCPAGNYSNTTKSSSCPPCDAGLYANADAATVCFDCAAGTFSGGGATTCDDCQPGRASNVTRASGCNVCDAGYFAAGGERRCQECGVGRFSGNESGICTPCENGTYAMNSTSTTCGICGAGTFSEEGFQQCVDCTEGEFAAAPGSAECLQCDPGSFQENSTSSGCATCPPGRFARISGQNKCEFCPKGFSTATSGASACTPCRGNYYTDDEGLQSCKLCAPGKVASRQHDSCIDSYLQDAAVKFVFLAACLIGLLFIALTAITWVVLRENRIINFSSPPFMYLAMFGHALVFGSIVLWVWDTSQVVCHFRNILLNFGVNIALMSVTLKTWRLHRIFNRSKSDTLKTVRITNLALLNALIITIILDSVILFVWWGAAPFEVLDLSNRCVSDGEPWVHAPLWAWKGALCVFLMYLIVKVRHIDERFNESRWLEMALYNIMMVIAVLVVLTVALNDNIAPRFWFVMFATMLYYLNLSTFCLLFIPTFYKIYISKNEYDDLYGSSVAEEVEEAEEALEKEKKQETAEAVEKKKGVADMTDDEKLNKLFTRRNKKAKEMEKLLKIVERSKQRMKTDITSLNNLHSDVLALGQEIEYRKQLMRKQGKTISNQYETPHDLASASGAAVTDDNKDAASSKPSKPDIELSSGYASGGAASGAAASGGAVDRAPSNEYDSRL